MAFPERPSVVFDKHADQGEGGTNGTFTDPNGNVTVVNPDEVAAKMAPDGEFTLPAAEGFSDSSSK